MDVDVIEEPNRNVPMLLHIGTAVSLLEEEYEGGTDFKDLMADATRDVWKEISEANRKILSVVRAFGGGVFAGIGGDRGALSAAALQEGDPEGEGLVGGAPLSGLFAGPL